MVPLNLLPPTKDSHSYPRLHELNISRTQLRQLSFFLLLPSYRSSFFSSLSPTLQNHFLYFSADIGRRRKPSHPRFLNQEFIHFFIHPELDYSDLLSCSRHYSILLSSFSFSPSPLTIIAILSCQVVSIELG